MSSPADDDPVPRLPRGRGIKLDGGMFVRIGMTLALLVMVIVTARPCANATSQFVTGFGEEGSASAVMPKPGNVDEQGAAALESYEQIGPNASPEEVRAAIERAKAKAKAAAGSGAAGSGAAGSGAAGSGAAGSGAVPGAAAAGSAGSAGGA